MISKTERLANESTRLRSQIEKDILAGNWQAAEKAQARVADIATELFG